MSSGAHVWVAGTDEAETVARLLVGFRDHLGKDWPSENAFLAGVDRLIEDRQTEFVIGAPDADAPPAGIVALRFRHSLWTASPDCLLEDVFVEANARGTGLGRTLVAFALERARERGCRRAELDVNESNAAALRLYESLGFGKKATPWEGRDLFINIRLD
jgi:ribosomal protein S18 acetylase RimI-like enzyme